MKPRPFSSPGHAARIVRGHFRRNAQLVADGSARVLGRRVQRMRASVQYHQGRHLEAQRYARPGDGVVGDELKRAFRGRIDA